MYQIVVNDVPMWVFYDKRDIPVVLALSKAYFCGDRYEVSVVKIKEDN